MFKAKNDEDEGSETGGQLRGSSDSVLAVLTKEESTASRESKDLHLSRPLARTHQINKYRSHF
jgi:hypothetical protein